jgi:hypothetical protein
MCKGFVVRAAKSDTRAKLYPNRSKQIRMRTDHDSQGKYDLCTEASTSSGSSDDSDVIDTDSGAKATSIDTHLEDMQTSNNAITQGHPPYRSDYVDTSGAGSRDGNMAPSNDGSQKEMAPDKNSETTKFARRSNNTDRLTTATAAYSEEDELREVMAISLRESEARKYHDGGSMGGWSTPTSPRQQPQHNSSSRLSFPTSINRLDADAAPLRGRALRPQLRM